MRFPFWLVFVLAACKAPLPSQPDPYEPNRNDMVTRQLAARDITDPAVLDAMGRVERHRFVPEPLKDRAYTDQPLPIGHGQTISQPYIVAAMTQLLKPSKDHIVLEIGTGSGYQAAVLAELVKHVYTIEIVAPLAARARNDLYDAGYTNITVRHGDGYRGWPEHAPFDGIMVTAAPDHIPKPLTDQLKPGGRMVLPMGPRNGAQQLLLLTKHADGSIQREVVMLVRFVPFTGEAVKRGNQ
ncbi:MAG: protein-L-isoaspartate(D-aspartate) O-methyltransferase [Acidobacteriota bacterium]|nr:protein-L-isoaspartate(D-aspartate) O-methyltransferase [Acidobacteriota bacterium]